MPVHDALLRLSKPLRVDLNVTRGDSVLLVLTVRTNEGTRVPLTGLSGQAVARIAIDDTTTYTLDVAVSQSAAGQADTGRITLTAPGARTLLWPDVGHWGLQLQDSSPDGAFRKSICQGRLRLVRDVVVP